ncbi:MFS transporter [bacterium]|nr:MAG: MFS transporter [bacterium]
MLNPWRGLGQLPRELWIVFATTLINRMGMMALPFLVLYLTRSLNFSSAQASYIYVGYGVGALVTAPFAGKLSDLVGHRRLMLLSLFMTGAVLLAFPLASDFFIVLIVTLIWAVVSEAYRPSSLAVIMDLSLPEQRKAAYALQRLAINIGMSFGPAIGGFLVLVSYPLLFIVNGLTTLVSGIVFLILPWRVQEHHTDVSDKIDLKSPPTPKLNSFKDLKLIFFLAAMLPVVIVFFQHASSMSLFLVNDLLLPESAYGILFTINTGLIILIEVAMNIAMAHWPYRRALTLGTFLIAAGFGAMAFANGMPAVAVTVVIWTFGEMIVLPTAAAYMGHIAPASRRGEYMGLYQMMFGLAFIIGPWLGLHLYEHFNAQVLWAAMFGIGILSTLMMRQLRE